MINWLKTMFTERPAELAILAAVAWAFAMYGYLSGYNFSRGDQAIAFAPLTITVIYFVLVHLRKDRSGDQDMDD